MSLASWALLTLLAGTALLAIGWGCARVIQRHAAWENAIARTVFLLLLAMPLALVLGPRIPGSQWQGAPWIGLAVDSWEQVPRISAPVVGRRATPPGRQARDVRRSPALTSWQERTSGLPLFHILLWVWSAGAAGSLASLGVGLRRIRRLVRDSRPVPLEESQSMLVACARTAGVGCPALRAVGGLSSPLQVGWLHPMILVPETSAAPSREVLLHELAHLRRLDLWWMTLGRVVAVFWWFHPLIWVLARRLERSAERVCDDLVVLWTQDAPGYAAQLVAFLLSSTGIESSPGMGIAVTGFRSGLGRRVARLLEPGRRLQVSIGRAGRALLAAGAVAVLGVAASVAPSRGENPAAADGQVIGEIHVSNNLVDENGESTDILPPAEAIAISGLRAGAKFDDSVGREAARRLLATDRFEYVRVSIEYVPSFAKPVPGGGVRVGIVYTPKFLPTEQSGSAGRSQSVVAAPSLAATVNRVPILTSSVDMQMAPRERDARAEYSGVDLAKRLSGLREEAMRELIDRELILQEGARRALAIPEEFIDNRIVAIVQQEFHGDYQAFRAELIKQGYTEEKFRAAERDKIAVQAVRYAGAGRGLSADERARQQEAWLQELRAKADIRIFPAS